MQSLFYSKNLPDQRLLSRKQIWTIDPDGTKLTYSVRNRWKEVWNMAALVNRNLVEDEDPTSQQREQISCNLGTMRVSVTHLAATVGS
jgi:hypothetical protein